MSRGSKMPVSSANRQKTIRTRKRSRSWRLVVRCGEGIVQVPDEFGGLDVGRVLVAEGAALHAEDEAELLDVGGQVRRV